MYEWLEVILSQTILPHPHPRCQSRSKTWKAHMNLAWVTIPESSGTGTTLMQLVPNQVLNCCTVTHSPALLFRFWYMLKKTIVSLDTVQSCSTQLYIFFKVEHGCLPWSQRRRGLGSLRLSALSPCHSDRNYNRETLSSEREREREREREILLPLRSCSILSVGGITIFNDSFLHPKWCHLFDLVYTV
jgi:hypothetical protein